MGKGSFTLIISITAEHIKKGIKGNNIHHCPVALALIDADPKGHLYCAHSDYLHVHKSDRLDRYVVPKVVKNFIRDFEKGPVSPFSVELDLIMEE